MFIDLTYSNLKLRNLAQPFMEPLQVKKVYLDIGLQMYNFLGKQSSPKISYVRFN